MCFSLQLQIKVPTPAQVCTASSLSMIPKPDRGTLDGAAAHPCLKMKPEESLAATLCTVAKRFHIFSSFYSSVKLYCALTTPLPNTRDARNHLRQVKDLLPVVCPPLSAGGSPASVIGCARVSQLHRTPPTR